MESPNDSYWETIFQNPSIWAPQCQKKKKRERVEPLYLNFFHLNWCQSSVTQAKTQLDAILKECLSFFHIRINPIRNSIGSTLKISQNLVSTHHDLHCYHVGLNHVISYFNYHESPLTSLLPASIIDSQVCSQHCPTGSFDSQIMSLLYSKPCYELMNLFLKSCKELMPPCDCF